MPRRGKNRDANEEAIVRALEAVGASVSYVDGEDGEPDLLVGFAGRTELMEVKRPISAGGGTTGGASRPVNGGDGVSTARQIDWRRRWRGKPSHLVTSAVEALAAIGFVGDVAQAAVDAHRHDRVVPLPPRRRGKLATTDDAAAIRAQADPAAGCARLRHPKVIGTAACACGARGYG